jgi:hypothetical protein
MAQATRSYDRALRHSVADAHLLLANRSAARLEQAQELGQLLSESAEASWSADRLSTLGELLVLAEADADAAVQASPAWPKAYYRRATARLATAVRLQWDPDVGGISEAACNEAIRVALARRGVDSMTPAATVGAAADLATACAMELGAATGPQGKIHRVDPKFAS